MKRSLLQYECVRRIFGVSPSLADPSKRTEWTIQMKMKACLISSTVLVLRLISFCLCRLLLACFQSELEVCVYVVLCCVLFLYLWMFFFYVLVFES